MKSALAKQAEQFLSQFGDEEAIAEHFGVEVNKVKTWKRFGKYPQQVFEAMFEAATAGQPETQEALIEEPGQPVEVEPETSLGDGQTTLDDIKNMLQDLHSRLGAVEGFINQGPNIPHSDVRPIAPSRAQSAAERAGIVNSGLPQVGVGTGIAPSRDQAHASANGPRGNPAGPARQRRQLQPGDPGWNAGWNDRKPKVQMVPVPVAAWPTNR